MAAIGTQCNKYMSLHFSGHQCATATRKNSDGVFFCLKPLISAKNSDGIFFCPKPLTSVKNSADIFFCLKPPISAKNSDGIFFCPKPLTSAKNSADIFFCLKPLISEKNSADIFFCLKSLISEKNSGGIFFCPKPLVRASTKVCVHLFEYVHHSILLWTKSLYALRLRGYIRQQKGIVAHIMCMHSIRICTYRQMHKCTIMHTQLT